MGKISKRLKEAFKDVDIEKGYSLKEAVELMVKTPATKFDETVELHFHLNVNPKNADQLVRGTVSLPHGVGKDVRVAVFCQGEAVAKAEAAGADFVGGKDLIDKVTKGFLDFDSVVATPDMMRDLSKLGRVLGPRGLMPTPKAGTVTQDVERAIKEVKAGRIEFKTDKQSGVHVGVGKRSFKSDQIIENAQFIIDAVLAAKPAAVKGSLIKNLSLSTTMGPGFEGGNMIKVGQLYRESMANTVRDNVRSRGAAFVVNYTGLKASQITGFRKELQAKKAELYATRKTIAGIALKDLDAESLIKDLDGQTAFVWSDTDVVEISKALVDFSKTNESFVVRGGLLDGAILTEGEVKRLADLPSREVLLAQLLGTIQAPLTNLVSVLSANSRNLVSILKQYSDQQGGTKMSEDTNTAVEEKTAEKKETVQVSDKLEKVITTIEGLTALELSDLVKALEDRLGVSAAMPMMAGPMVAAGGDAPAEEKTEFDVILKDIGANKISVIKEVRGITSLGLKEAKDLVEAAPKAVKEGVTKEEAEEIKTKLEAAGAKVELA